MTPTSRIRPCLTLAAFAAAMTASVPLSAEPSRGPPPATVYVDPVRSERIELRREVTGELRAVRRSVVAAEEPGLVIELNVEPGDVVTADQVIARLRDTEASLEVERTEALIATRIASIAERTARLERARRDLQRRQDSFNRGALTEFELDEQRTLVSELEALLAQARSELAQAEAEAGLARKRLGDMTIRAPYAGVVIAKKTEVGQWIALGDSIAEITELAILDAYIEVPEAFIDRLTPPTGASPIIVQLAIPALRGEIIQAPVTAVIPAADPLSRLFPVRIRLDNPEGRLKPGMSLVGIVPTGVIDNALTIHRDAILRSDTGPYVYFDADGTAQIAPVQILYAEGNRLVVRSDALSPGMNLVTEGNQRLFPHQPIRILNPQPDLPPHQPRTGP